MLYFGRSPWMLQAVFALRQAVFVEEQHIPIDWEFDEKDQTCPYYLWLDGTHRSLPADINSLRQTPCNLIAFA